MRNLLKYTVTPAALSGALALGALGFLSGTSTASTAHPTSARFSVSATVSVDGTSEPITVTGAMSPARSTALVDLAGSKVRVERVATAVYVRPPASDAHLLGRGKTWDESSVSALERLAGLSSTGTFVLARPAKDAGVLALLTTLSSAAPKKTGTAVVRGVSTTRYTATIDLAKLASTAKGAARTSLKSLFGHLSSTRLPVAVWLDRSGRLRQLRTTLHTTLSVDDDTFTVVAPMTVQLYDFGAAVHVSAPASTTVSHVQMSVLASALF